LVGSPDASRRRLAKVDRVRANRVARWFAELDKRPQPRREATTTPSRSIRNPEAPRRPVAYGFLSATVAPFAVLGLAVWGVPGLASAWEPLALTAAAVSLALLIAVRDTRLFRRRAIDLALIAIAVTRPDWTGRIAT
jgi:hypothetical protein